MTKKPDISKQRIAKFCREHHIVKLSFFGSVLGEDFRADSDIDVLVEFHPEHIPGFIRLHQIEEELSALLGGHRVDMVTPKFLNRWIRERVLREAEVQYAEG